MGPPLRMKGVLLIKLLRLRSDKKDAKPVWIVPEGATPKYNVKKIAAVRAQHEKTLAKQKAQEAKKITKRLAEQKLAKRYISLGKFLRGRPLIIKGVRLTKLWLCPRAG